MLLKKIQIMSLPSWVTQFYAQNENCFVIRENPEVCGTQTNIF